MLLREGVLKDLCGGFVGEHPRWSVTSIKLQGGFIGVALWRGFFPLGLLGIFWGVFLWERLWRAASTYGILILCIFFPQHI